VSNVGVVCFPNFPKFGTLGVLVVPSKKESRTKKLKVKMNLKLDAIEREIQLKSQVSSKLFTEVLRVDS
jgi:hypothetical protein